MKQLFKFLGIIALVAVIGFGMIACDDPDDGGSEPSGDPALSGTITVDKTTAETGQELTATYSGSETVSFQWKRGGSNVGPASTTNPNKYTPTQAGSYTVTVSASGYKSKDSAAVNVTGETITDTVITNVSITVSSPSKDAAPATTIGGATNCTLTSITWSPVHTQFAVGEVYTVTVTLTANPLYTFLGLTQARINGSTSTQTVSNTGTTLTLSLTFPEVDDRNIIGFRVRDGFQPDKMIYNHGDTLDLGGLIVQIVYDSGTPDTENIPFAQLESRNITTEPTHGTVLSRATHNNQPVKITYGTRTVNTNNLTVNEVLPTAVDFNITGLGPFDYTPGTGRTVGVTAKTAGLGAISNITYNDETAAPTNAGSYEIKVDVVESEKFNAVEGLVVGTLVINKIDPVMGNFTVTGHTHTYDATPKTASVVIADGIVGMGSITSTLYGGNANQTNVGTGTYPITVSVAEGGNYKATTGLQVGTLSFFRRTPAVGDFDIVAITGTVDYDGSDKATTVTAKDSINGMGEVIIKYNGETTAPKLYGVYEITFEVNQGPNYMAKRDFAPLGNLQINFPVYTDAATFKTHMDAHPASTVATPYPIVVNMTDLEGGVDTLPRAVYDIRSNKFVTLDFSASTFKDNIVGGFDNCSNIISITLPASVTTIGFQAFTRCTNLTSFALHEGITTIGQEAFSYTVFTSIAFPTSLTTINQRAFRYSKLTSINIPSTVTTMGTGVFSNCTDLTQATIAEGVQSIPNETFSYCSNLAGVTIPTSVTAIGEGAFQRSGITSITIPDGVTRIEKDTFDSCSKLDNVTIPANVTFIGNSAFSSAGISSITIPASVTRIEMMAFYMCPNLTSVTILGSPPISGAPFDSSSLISITFGIGSNITSWGNYDFPNSSGDALWALYSAETRPLAAPVTFTRTAGQADWAKN
jgi:hypothetical protein